jgi:hypothetical protein
MTNDETYRKASRGIKALSQRMKFLAQEHRERIKQLRKLQDHLDAVDAQTPTGPELLPIEVTLAPEVVTLVNNPTHGL